MRALQNSKILVLGDLHGNFSKLNALIAKEKPSLILQCGDFGYWPHFDHQALSCIDTENTTIYFCEGNNDDIRELLVQCGGKPEATPVHPGIYYMPRGSVLQLDDGRRVMFVGGALSVDRFRRHKGLDWFPEEILLAEDLRLLPDENMDIIISHTCPLEFDMEKYLRYCSNDIDPSRQVLSEVLQKYRPDLWYFGHFHIQAGDCYDNTNWFALSWYKEYPGWFKLLPPAPDESTSLNGVRP